MKIIYIIIIILYPILTNGQVRDIKIKDFNQDGHIDTLEINNDSGSGFGGKYVTLINGKTKEIFELNDFSCFCEIINVIPIPDKLLLKENIAFYNVLKNELLSTEQDPIDPSLDWLLGAYLNWKILQDNPYFDIVIKSPLKWRNGDIKLPSLNYINLQGDTLKKISKLKKDFASESAKVYQNAWLTYRGHTHAQVSNETKAGEIATIKEASYNIWKTAHGIIISRDNRYSWVFVTDFNLTGAPQKLRWTSIGKIVEINGHLIFQMINSNDFSNPIFVLNMDSGVIARISSDFYESDSTFSVDITHLKIQKNDVLHSIAINELFKAIKLL